MALAVPVGIACGNALLPISSEVNTKVEEVTGQPTGNAGVIEMAETACENKADPNACYETYDVPDDYKLSAVIIAPISEELVYRAIPSMIVDERDGRHQDRYQTLLHGTDYVLPTRNELIVGAISSVVFGLVHNLTSTGIDTRTIPASQTVGGFALWVLQRRFGSLSNLSAHAAFNYAVGYRK